jgi:hypothetical protein
MRASNINGIRFRFLIGLALLIAISFGCGGPSPAGGQSGSSGELPEITQEIINERINDAWVREVPEETGTGQPISWNFDHNEPKEIKVVDKQMNGTRATIVLDITTSSAPRARANRRLAGQIRTEWQLETGWVLRRWEIIGTENISLKYKDLPKPEGSNSNR